MKKVGLLAGIVCSVALLAPMTQATEVFSRNVVGYHNITIEPGLNLVAFPFQKIPVSTGVITAHDAHNQITVDGVNLEAILGDYDEPGESTFYVEITTDAFEGRHFYVTAKDNDTLTIDLPAEAESDVKANDLVNAGYKIVAANRIRDLFGEEDAPTLAGGSSSLAADNILVWQDGGGWGLPIYFQTADPFFGTPVNKWMQGSAQVADMVIDRDQGVFVRRQGAPDATLTVVGEVSANKQQIVLQSGLNLVGGLAVVPEELGAAMTQTLSGASSSLAADNILVWQDGGGWALPIYYQTTDPFFGTPVNKWMQGSQEADFSFDPVRGYFIRVQTSPLGTWVRESPLAAQ